MTQLNGIFYILNYTFLWAVAHVEQIITERLPDAKATAGAAVVDATGSMFTTGLPIFLFTIRKALVKS